MKKSSTRRRERGATMVESAIALPVVLLFILGTLIFCNFLVRKLVFSRATSVAAREASIAATDIETVASTKFFGYLHPLGMDQNASINVEWVDQDGLCGLQITGVSGRWCQFCEAYLGIGTVSSRKIVPIEDPPTPCT